MVKPTHSWQCNDFGRRRWPRCDRPPVRRILAETQVATVLVVVADVRPDEANEMTLAEDHDVLEELSTAAADPALGGSVLPRTAVGDPNRLGAHGLDELDHGGAEYRVAVEEEVSRRRVVEKRLT
jgi:hypothetical protein